jgi:hypothetical protein
VRSGRAFDPARSGSESVGRDIGNVTETAMPDIDPLAFGIRFALTHQMIGREATSLSAR